MMSMRAKRALWNGCHAISKRIIKIRFYLKHKKLTVIQTHAPRNDVTDKEKDEFYN